MGNPADYALRIRLCSLLLLGRCISTLRRTFPDNCSNRPYSPKTIQAIGSAPAMSSPRLPSKWLGSFPAYPRHCSVTPNAAVTRLHTGRGSFYFTGSIGTLRPPLLVPRPTHRRLLMDGAPRGLAPRGAEFPIRGVAVPAPFALSRHSPPSGFIPRRALWKMAQSASRTFAFEVRAPSTRGINKKTSGVRSLERGGLGSGMPPQGGITSTIPRIFGSGLAETGRFPSKRPVELGGP
jgi:hypothetical protein